MSTPVTNRHLGIISRFLQFRSHMTQSKRSEHLFMSL